MSQLVVPIGRIRDGSASIPGLSFALDPNTGLRRSATDEMRLVTGGVDRLMIDAAGAVTIGGQPVVVGNDSRLTDQRVPTNGSVTTAKIDAGGLAPSAITGTAVITTDSRLSDQRVPTALSVDAGKVAASLKPSGTAAAGTEALRALGTSASTAAAGNDSRLSDQRTPTDNSVSTAKLQTNAVTAVKVATDARPPRFVVGMHNFTPGWVVADPDWGGFPTYMLIHVPGVRTGWQLTYTLSMLGYNQDGGARNVTIRDMYHTDFSVSATAIPNNTLFQADLSYQIPGWSFYGASDKWTRFELDSTAGTNGIIIYGLLFTAFYS